MTRNPAHEALRSGTRIEHERLDGLFAHFDLTDADGYRRFLTAHALALPPVEAAIDAAGFARVLPDWPGRRRAAALARDLAALDAPLPEPLPFPPLGDEAAAWGAAYVLEGSRLGGAFLARQLATGSPASYLGTPQPAGAWRGFLSALDAGIDPDGGIDTARATAGAVFALFEHAGRRVMAGDGICMMGST